MTSGGIISTTRATNRTRPDAAERWHRANPQRGQELLQILRRVASRQEVINADLRPIGGLR